MIKFNLYILIRKQTHTFPLINAYIPGRRRKNTRTNYLGVETSVKHHQELSVYNLLLKVIFSIIMFRGFKNAIKGGIGTVSEKSQDLASTVVNDQDFSTSAIKDKLKETTKRTYKEGKILYKEGAEDFRDKVGHENVDKVSTTTKDAAHNIKHYGAFGENLLGYSDPQKELRKAVKAKEKAAKKAKKAKKKKGEKVEDLFDPENLAKYKKELEEKRNLRDLAAPVSPGRTYQTFLLISIVSNS